MLWQAGLVLAGLIARLWWPGLLPGWSVLLLLLLSIAGLALTRLRYAGFLLAGACLGQAAVDSHYGAIQHTDERVIAEAEITGIPRVTAAGVSVDAQLWFPRDARRPPQHARLNWPGPAGRRLHAGERWQLLLRLRPPRASYNPGSVDLERNYLRDHVQSLASVAASPLNQRLFAAPVSLLVLREQLARRIGESVTDPASSALLAALAVGATGDVTRGQWRVFNATGITHLVAISGMHVTLFAVVAMGAARRLWSLAVRLGLRARRDRFAAVAGILLAAGYALLAGFSVPTQRTLIMLTAWLLLRECGRASRPSASVALALLVVIVLDPFAVLSAGFWLSFIAVAAIIGIAGGRILPEGKVRTAVSVQSAVFIALLPVTLAIFGSVSIAGLVVNIVAIPVFTFTLVPLALAATATLLVLPATPAAVLAGLILRAAEVSANAMGPWLARAADHPQALWLVTPQAGWYPLAAVAVLLALLPWPWRLRLVGIGALLPLLGASHRPAAAQLDATVLDVGQATAVLLQTQGHALLYGTGDGFRSQGGEIERVVVPYARSGGLFALDAVLLPRVDRDSGAGVTALHALLPPERVLAGRSGANEMPPGFGVCRGGDSWDWDGWRFDVLAEPTDSCTLRVSGPGGALLLTGSLDARAEHYLVSRGLAGIDVLLVPRHAGAAASSPSFLAALGARQAIASLRASAKASESYARVAERYASQGMALHDTAAEGAIRLRFAPGVVPQLNGSREARLGVWSVDPAGVR